MPAQYERDENGVVHLMSPWGGGEFTFCDRPNDGDPVGDGINTKPHPGPATCQRCLAGADEMREALKGARWRKS